MAAKKTVRGSQKHQLVDKANSRIVVLTAAASFILVFTLVAAYILIGQMAYQNKVIAKNQAAVDQLDEDIANVDHLVAAYQAFESHSVNIIGGSPTGNGNQDGDNAKIVLDALPSQYDYPALTASLEKILVGDGVTIESMEGTDEQVDQENSASSTPQPVEMPIEFSVSGNYKAIQAVVVDLNRSIRPIQINTLEITGSDSKMTLDVSATAYYQPAKTLQIRNEVVK